MNLVSSSANGDQMVPALQVIFLKIIETKYLTHMKEYSNTCLDTMGILVYDNSQLKSHLLSFIGMFACVRIIVDDTLHTSLFINQAFIVLGDKKMEL